MYTYAVLEQVFSKHIALHDEGDINQLFGMLQTVKYDGIIAYEDSKYGKKLDINCLLDFCIAVFMKYAFWIFCSIQCKLTATVIQELLKLIWL